jgi:hypothetical protein
LTVLGVAVLASTGWFTDRSTFISTFGESVNGLEVGAPVKFQGVPVGSVTQLLIQIELSDKTFEVPVQYEIDLTRLTSQAGTFVNLKDEAVLRQQINDGLRAQLQMESIVTGQLYVELTYRPDAPQPDLGERSTNYPEIPTTPSLLAAGASICGVSAVVAIGRVLDARGTAITFAAATVLLFDAATPVAFPLAGEWLGLSSRQFGVWAGVSMFSTGPVAAAGFAHSPEAGQWATVTKLARNSLLGGVAVAYSLAYTARSATDPGVRRLWAEFPKFLLGFLAVAAVANSGLLSPAALESIGRVSDALFILAFVGLGLSIRLREMREVGGAAVGAVLVHLLVVSALALAAVRWLL